MKKNKILRLASVMLMLCLITTCAISGTFAKYTTDGTATDSARVAKWGVKVATTGAFADESTFGSSYVKTTSAFTAGDNTVVGTSTAQVVAPGTNGTMAAVSITGTPEVGVAITYTANLTLSNWKVSGVDYCPIVFTVAGTELKINGSYDKDGVPTNISSVSDLENAVEYVISKLSVSYLAPGTVLDNQTFQPEVTWAWGIDSTVNTYIDDEKDTALGDAATAPEITLALTVTVDQVD